MWRHKGFPGQPNTVIHQVWIPRRHHLLNNGTLSYLSGMKLNCFHLKDSPPKRRWSVFWSDHWHQYNSRWLPLTAFWIIDLPLKLDNVWLLLFLEVKDLATFAPITWLKLRHTLCWRDPYITPSWRSSNRFLKMRCVKGVSNLFFFNWTVYLILPHISRRLPHFATPRNSLVWQQLHVCFWLPGHSNQFHVIF